LNAVGTIIAFRGSLIIGMNIDRIIRTSLHASLAADAPVPVKIDNAVFALPECCDGTDLDARSVSTMIATLYGEDPAGVGEFPLFDVFDPRTVHTDRQTVFLFAGDRAGMT